ncbi:helix-turn-helix transcriptional regulator [Chryseobacterium sp. ES2]|uniref:Helix-turn-helix transcriptional regulator n=1 Tax=Chryseobacterium metallicongregator TaxID=3073042 RepID=A0ABU1E3H5_9FLAO|nr:MULTISPECIES: AraC family transcriptional regulator [Chryseobacterium]MDR4952341.1 helix-turn-helix transcriptional regulator [Chryseobacterium sp. ES2]
MNTLRNGEYFGDTNQRVNLDGLTITDTEYTHPYVDWHYHENAYFTFLLQGNMTEGNRKEVYGCSAGTLLYHHWEDPHYNIKPDIFTRGFHIELSQSWFNRFDIQKNKVEGSFNIKNPALKLLVYQMFKETKGDDISFELAFNQLLLNLFGQLTHQKESTERKPLWVGQINEILHESFTESLNLTELSKILNIHPIHLSRDFHKYFHCNLGEYLRKLKLNKSLELLTLPHSLTDIALECGFSDQSHFIRCFKENMGITPLKYRNLLKTH